LGAQAPVDTSKIGPQIGAAAPAFSGPDQDGVSRTLASAAGRKGTMLVFFRSADW
jgi:peroxiredoxin